MRYTLRLLTLQQFQRAAALMCACEVRRRALTGRRDATARWGETPFRIGLWVGQASTPNRTEDAEAWSRRARQRSARRARVRRRCSSRAARGAARRSSRRPRRRGRPGPRPHAAVLLRTRSGACAFTQRNSPDEGLPVVVVDEEIYRLLPSLVIATVDKFAQMPWDGADADAVRPGRRAAARATASCRRTRQRPEASTRERGALPAVSGDATASRCARRT